MPEDTADRLRYELVQVQIESLKAQVENLKIDTEAKRQQLKIEIDDHEKRIRLVEETSTRFNFLLYLTMGGGLVSLFNLFAIVIMIIRVTNK
jgi:hypothetical protein